MSKLLERVTKIRKTRERKVVHDYSVGNGDTCPINADHGRMLMMGTGTQFCPHSDHRGDSPSSFMHDGVTPTPRWQAYLARQQEHSDE